ncbi:esterase [Gordonia phage Mollymur]|uniref:Esterase n=1 Tax=Gordonia phage Mollymur TaxID=2590895 RepID=A0A4Y6EJB2_9CAUD|nr:esterase [Gordonia phage Mollymur]QDF15404.1 esterase [Gordonia phage Mollymur]
MRILRGAWIALAAVVTAAVVGIAPASASEHIDYVALGDSRAATPSYSSLWTSSDGCARTPAAYPEALAKTLGADLTSKACVAARTENVTTNPQLTLRGFRPPQVRALSADTDLVTLSIGGNDIGWYALIESCFPRAIGTDARCREDARVASRISSALATLPAKLDRTLTSVGDRAPNAEIVLVGHGGYYGSTGCAAEVTASDADLAYIDGFFDRFNAVLSSAADRAGATFVDVAGPAKGHDACAGSQAWFRGNVRDTSQPWQNRHPTPLGSTAMAELIAAAL